MNSPEMKAAKERIKELEDKCREAGRAMIELNVKYETALADLARSKETISMTISFIKRN